jgi:hypothetical protein
MTPIQFLTDDQLALVPEYQEKWRRVYRSTEPIDRERAKSAIQRAYRVMGQEAPEIIFRASPRQAMETLLAQVVSVEPPQVVKPSDDFFRFFLQAAWSTYEIKKKQQQSGITPIFNLYKEVGQETGKTLVQHIDRCLPKDMDMRDILQQVFSDASPMFASIGSLHEDPELSKMLQDNQAQEWLGSLENIEEAFRWFPGRELVWRAWLKQMLPGLIISKVSSVKHPQFQQTIYSSFSRIEHQAIAENPAFSTPGWVVSCIWLDFAKSVLNYPVPTEKWDVLKELIENCGWIFAVKNTCIVSDRPTSLLLDAAHQLHGEGQPALKFSDGSAYYVAHGIILPEKYGAVHPSQWSAQWVIEETSSGLQDALVRGIGAERLCQELPMTELETLAEYTLLSIETARNKNIVILKRMDSNMGTFKAVKVAANTTKIRSAIEYANLNYSAEDFPLPNL